MSHSIHIEASVRTNIELDDELVAEAMAGTGLPTKRATVEQALRVLVLRHRQKTALANLAGLGWEGDLDATREARSMISQNDRG
jgi:Arc/MetJ family transcription regulator